MVAARVATQVTPAPYLAQLGKRAGGSTCGYFNGDQNQPFNCPASLSCTLYPFGALFGCVNDFQSLADTCFDADQAETLRKDALNCSPAAPYCNTLYLYSSNIKMSTWTCGTSAGTSSLLYTFTNAAGGGGPATTSPTAQPGSSNPQASTAMTTSQTTSSAQPSPTQSSDGVSLGVIIGPIIGGISAIVVAILTVWCIRRRAKERERFEREQADRKERFDREQARQKENFDLRMRQLELQQQRQPQ